MVGIWLDSAIQQQSDPIADLTSARKSQTFGLRRLPYIFLLLLEDSAQDDRPILVDQIRKTCVKQPDDNRGKDVGLHQPRGLQWEFAF